ncbi:tetratricopeptide repeat-containing sulfotransferase family protein [Candidatus Pelagibacter bacterium nBUS_36]|uniref:tetratricopeptide repeat-containing sulfotransferase family protein n=1 Tax=Candidatus Pelagibacter bacterium nBUS_36 TaxID=3374194 RepID=UPI003EB73D94
MLDKNINEYLQKGEFKKTLKILENLIKNSKQNIWLFFYLGKTYYKLNDYKKSIFYFRKCNQIKPNSPKVLYNLALVFQGLGRINEAEKLFNKLIDINSDDVHSYYGLFNLNINNITQNYKKKLKDLSNNEKISLFEKSLINFIFSKLEKKEKKLKEEIRFLSLSHDLSFKSNYNYNIQSNFYYKKIITNHFDKIEYEGSIKTNLDFDQFNPIFIIGLPRSGSTLVESLISQSTDQIHSFGEFHAINMSIFDQIGSLIYSEKFDYKNFKFVINKEKFQDSLIERYGNIENKIFIDKSLENFFNIDIILQFFPNAKFLHTFRNFNDSIIGIYQRMMPDLSWSHDIKDILEYANNYKTIINHFKKEYPNNIMDINLEKLTLDKKKESQKIFEFCNINWNNDVLNFNKKNKLFTKTNSFLQIRDKIDKYNINKYEPYYYLLK